MVEKQQVEIIILGQPGCSSCTEAKKTLKAEIKSGKAKFVDIDSAAGKELDKKYPGINAVPVFIVNGKLKKDLFTRPDKTYYFK